MRNILVVLYYYGLTELEVSLTTATSLTRGQSDILLFFFFFT